MGAYVNPNDGIDKLVWLVEHGTKCVLVPDGFKNRPKNTFPVVLVENFYFKAAGICYSQEEYASFIDPNDTRIKIGFYVDIELLHTVSPQLVNYMQHS